MSYTYSATGLPPGLSLADGVLSGTPTTPGAYTVTLSVSDGVSTVSESVSMAIAPAPAPVPFWQLVLSAESGCYAGDFALLQQPALVTESGSYWRDQVLASVALVASSGSYWQDQVIGALTAEAGSYWRDQVVTALTAEAGSYWQDSVQIENPPSGFASPDAYWNLATDGNAAVGTTNFTAGSGVTFGSGYALSDGSSNATLIAADSADISIGDAAFTWFTWVYLPSNTTTFLIQKGFVPGTNYNAATFEWITFYDASAGRFKYIFYDGSNAAVSEVVEVGPLVSGSITNPSLNTWYLLKFYYKPGTGGTNEIGVGVGLDPFITTPTLLTHIDTSTNLTLMHRSQDGLYLPSGGRMRQTAFFKAAPTEVDWTYWFNSGAGRSL